MKAYTSMKITNLKTHNSGPRSLSVGHLYISVSLHFTGTPRGKREGRQWGQWSTGYSV